LVDKFTEQQKLFKQENGSDKQQPGQSIPLAALQPNSKGHLKQYHKNFYKAQCRARNWIK
jgi:hypothetical protein